MQQQSAMESKRQNFVLVHKHSRSEAKLVNQSQGVCSYSAARLGRGQVDFCVVTPGRGQVLSSTAPAHNFQGADVLGEGSSAPKHRTYAQNQAALNSLQDLPDLHYLVSETATRTLLSTRTGCQDDGS